MEMLTGTGHPSRHLVGEVGQHYKNLNNGDIWECISSNENSRVHHQASGGYIWKRVARGDHMEVCAGGEGGSGSGSVSWNDLTDKPFYTEEKMVVVAEAENINFELIDGYIETPFNIDITVGKTYNVVWDGIEYVCVAYTDGENGWKIIGNGVAAGVSGGKNEPFYFYNTQWSSSVGATEVGTHSFSVSTMKEVAHTLDAKYIGYDCVIRNYSSNRPSDITSLAECKIVSGGVQDVVAAFSNKRMPKVCYIFGPTDDKVYSGYVFEAFELEVEPALNRFHAYFTQYMGAGNLAVFEFIVENNQVTVILKNSQDYLT